ncbi:MULTISPECIES: ABC transporter ATP-binding protein [Planktothricoides]|uniref:ATP-binding cassette domain-containing protein n=2 Tax=Planktothricoides raciborskii TaxID=132608 RepID=A0AAU8JFE4_9CYAN|nr:MULTISPECIES: ATP-binding cassette domain-containing protein [Planktothricoides]KOR34868.1 cobalt ABC transporter [Planktothricoides sp. SR001]MBD2547278.1 ATP-binding cassette domain-containing protein [Planktothricoides raciborskii FACHB-1370]MBD2585640.1 ATP-binding cassette domain-containing protein [Planktothricoides raciborskii FACHB-1261]
MNLPSSPNSSLLRLEQVSLTAKIGNSYLLKDISFEVCRDDASTREGEFIAVVGATGAGKTSLLRLLNRLNEPTSGAIYWKNRDYRQIPVMDLRTSVTLVLQESKLLGMPVKEAIAYPLKLRGMAAPDIKQTLALGLEKWRIPDQWLEKTESQLSVGQRQLVALCRAWVIQPQILLLDEPTSALDTGRSAHVLAVLKELTTNGQTTILMVNHQLEFAAQYCTRVLHLAQGSLIQDVLAAQMDWNQLRQSLKIAETQTVDEWN